MVFFLASRPPARRRCASDREGLAPLELVQRLASLLVVDVRSRRQFARGHLPNSQSIPAGLLLAGELPEGELVLVDGGNGEADRLRQALQAAGYERRLLHLKGGFAAWRAAGLPVQAQAEPGFPDPRDWLAKPGGCREQARLGGA